MAYLHCHTKGCGWGQDDFWTPSYNPLTRLRARVRWYWKPRMVNFGTNTDAGMITLCYRTFSWCELARDIFKIGRGAWRMKWPTWKSWKRARTNAKCPNCGQNNFDID